MVVELEYVKLPIPVKASRWFKNGDHPHDYDKTISGFGKWPDISVEQQRRENWEGQVVRYFRHPEHQGDSACPECGLSNNAHGFIDTREGWHRVCPGDWILTGIEGERWPVKPVIFAKTYTLASTGNGSE